MLMFTMMSGDWSRSAGRWGAAGFVSCADMLVCVLVCDFMRRRGLRVA